LRSDLSEFCQSWYCFNPHTQSNNWNCGKDEIFNYEINFNYQMDSKIYLFVRNSHRMYPVTHPILSMFVWLVADGWCWSVLREKYCWLVVGG
jgi:hypothetical protein